MARKVAMMTRNTARHLNSDNEIIRVSGEDLWGSSLCRQRPIMWGYWISVDPLDARTTIDPPDAVLLGHGHWILSKI